jgi:hypothetical protein
MTGADRGTEPVALPASNWLPQRPAVNDRVARETSGDDMQRRRKGSSKVVIAASKIPFARVSARRDSPETP